jgi:hypothetical protein
MSISIFAAKNSEFERTTGDRSFNVGSGTWGCLVSAVDTFCHEHALRIEYDDGMTVDADHIELWTGVGYAVVPTACARGIADILESKLASGEIASWISADDLINRYLGLAHVRDFVAFCRTSNGFKIS